jgi:hypothetical protein
MPWHILMYNPKISPVGPRKIKTLIQDIIQVNSLIEDCGMGSKSVCGDILQMSQLYHAANLAANVRSPHPYRPLPIHKHSLLLLYILFISRLLNDALSKS